MIVLAIGAFFLLGTLGLWYFMCALTNHTRRSFALAGGFLLSALLIASIMAVTL